MSDEQRNGKGDKRRPMLITPDEWRQNFERVFAEKARKRDRELAQEKSDGRAKD